MSEIPSTGNIGVDISIALIAGAWNYMVNPLLNRLQIKKEEHMDITKQKIANIATFETVTMQIASSLFQVEPYWIRRQRMTVIMTGVFVIL